MTKKPDDELRFEILDMIERTLGRLEEDTQLELPLAKANRQMSASAHTIDRVQARSMQPLNDSELKSVYALLAYVSHNENIQQETVQAIVEANFGVNHITKLQQKDYDEVIRFLVDLRIDEMRN